MPTYDFKCQKCGHIFELNQGMNDQNPTCSELQPSDVPDLTIGRMPCGGETEKVYLSASPVHFSGSGWAKDGYSK